MQEDGRCVITRVAQNYMKRAQEGRNGAVDVGSVEIYAAFKFFGAAVTPPSPFVVIQISIGMPNRRFSAFQFHLLSS